MEGLDDLLDDLADSPKKCTPKGVAKDTNKKQKKSVDEFEGMLDEVLGNEEKPKIKKPSNSFQPIKKVKDSDLDFPEYDEEKKDYDPWGGGTGESPSYKPGSKTSAPKKPKKGDKCYPVVLAGEDIPSGYCANSMNLAVCDKMMCLECAHNVVRIIGKKWENDVDYLFFRNYIKRPNKLETKVITASGYCAYACQCKWHSTNTKTNLPYKDIKWVCSGH